MYYIYYVIYIQSYNIYCHIIYSHIIYIYVIQCIYIYIIASYFKNVMKDFQYLSYWTCHNIEQISLSLENITYFLSFSGVLSVYSRILSSSKVYFPTYIFQTPFFLGVLSLTNCSFHSRSPKRSISTLMEQTATCANKYQISISSPHVSFNQSVPLSAHHFFFFFF